MLPSRHGGWNTVLNFSWVIPLRLAGGARPGWLGDLRVDLEFLWEQGVRGIVGFVDPGTTMDYSGAPGCVFEILRLQVEDHTAPPPEVLGQGIDFIERCRKQELPVLVHCLAGIGRTGTLLACYLARAQGLDGADALARLRVLRPNSVETREQEAAVLHFTAPSTD